MTTYRITLEFVIEADDVAVRADALGAQIATDDTIGDSRLGMSQQPVEDLLSLALFAGATHRLSELAPTARLVDSRRTSATRGD